MWPIIISLTLAFASLGYAVYLHFYYQGRTRSVREIELEKFKQYMANLGYKPEDIEEHIHNYPTLADLCEVNQKMKKAFKKFKK